MSFSLLICSILSVLFFCCRSSTFFHQFSLSLVNDDPLSLSSVHYLCLCLAPSFLLVLSSILPVFSLRCLSFSFFSPFSLSVASTVVPPRTFANSPWLCFPLSIFLLLIPFSVSFAFTVVPSGSFVNSPCLSFTMSFFLLI